MKISLRRRAQAVALVVMSLAAPAVLADEHAEHAAPAAPAASMTPAAPVLPVKRPVAAPAPSRLPAAAESTASAGSGESAAAHGEADSLAHVRELLAEKLGARQTSKVGGPNDIRVAARGSEEPAAEAKRSRPVAAAPRRQAAAAEAPVAPLPHGEWAYDGSDGPAAWSQLKPEYAQCATGQRQSPIDIRDGIAVQLDPVKFDYHASGFSVIDNGHTVQVNLAPGNSIEILGRRYDLVQFHFHRPSEERINGKQYDMVVHLVHKDSDGRLAVVAVLLERGAAQPIVQSIWNNLPLEKHEELAAQSIIDLNQLLPDDRRYYTYMGSLTTPPCSEGVLWMVMKKPVPIATEQISVFTKLYPMNARPLQSASGRLIKESQ